MARLHSPPPTRFGSPGAAQAKPADCHAGEAASARLHSPPPTRFGSPGAAQAKPTTGTAGAGARLHSPPPTRFGSPGTAQAKPAGTVPPTAYGSPAPPPTRTAGVGMMAPSHQGSRTVQKMNAKPKPKKMGPTYGVTINCLGYAMGKLMESAARRAVKGIQWGSRSREIMEWIQNIIWSGADDTFNLTGDVRLKFFFASEISDAPNGSIIVGVYEFDDGQLTMLEHEETDEDYLTRYKHTQQDDAHYFFKSDTGILTGVPYQKAGEQFPVEERSDGIFQHTKDDPIKVYEVLGYIVLAE